MNDIIAVANQKGGVGKTTTVVNIAAFAALAGKKILIVDTDPQGNASSVFASDYVGPSVFGGGEPLSTTTNSIDIIPAGDDLLAQEERLNQLANSGHFLNDIIRDIREQYDLILIDCQPSLTVLPANALQAADRVLIPIQCEYYAMEGLGQILAFLEHQAEIAGDKPGLAGILLTMYDPDIPLCKQVVAEVQKHFQDLVFETLIPRDISMAAAPSHGSSILQHDPLCAGALAYLEATKELLDALQ